MIHQIYHNQALKPRGNNVNEKLDFIVSWYSKSANQIEPSDKHQKEMCDLMAEWSSYGLLNLKKERSEDTKEAINNLLPTVVSKLQETNLSTGEKSFYSYLYLELSRTVE
jgi:hypothetical protein